jgi:acyl-coenzyme A thioesterase PaaI-like protein
VNGAKKDMSRWLGDGGMTLIGAVGAAFEEYGVDGEDLGWVRGSFRPSELACNPHGAVQAGVHALLLDASMNFAINAALAGRDRTQATIEMTTELLRPAELGGYYVLRGDVVRLTRQIAYGEATLTLDEGKLVSRSTGTFLVQRAASSD